MANKHVDPVLAFLACLYEDKTQSEFSDLGLHTVLNLGDEKF